MLLFTIHNSCSYVFVQCYIHHVAFCPSVCVVHTYIYRDVSVGAWLIPTVHVRLLCTTASIPMCLSKGCLTVTILDLHVQILFQLLDDKYLGISGFIRVMFQFACRIFMCTYMELGWLHFKCILRLK